MAGTVNDDAVRIALAGIRAGYADHRRTNSQATLTEAVISAVACVQWACALDDLFGHGELRADYAGRRNRDPDGKLLLGLRFVRNQHMQQVVMAASGDGRRLLGPPQPSAGLVWKPADSFALTGGGRDDAELRIRYRRDLEGRATHHALWSALRWLSTEASTEHSIELSERESAGAAARS